MTSRRIAVPLVVALVLVLAACGAKSGSAGPSLDPNDPRAPLIGSWQTTITGDDLRAGGVKDPVLVDQNSGRITLTYAADGTWTFVQESLTDIALWEPVFRGTYTVVEAQATHVVTYPQRYAAEGAHDTVSWRIDGDALHLTLVDGGDEFVKVVYEAHPWQRVVGAGA